MRWALFILLAGLIGTGCRDSVRTGAVDQPPATVPERPGEVVPANDIAGKVIAANPRLRFVIAEFLLSELPPIGQLMNVYRAGQKVGEIRISGPSEENTIAADITAGEAQVGDELRIN